MSSSLSGYAVSTVPCATRSDVEESRELPSLSGDAVPAVPPVPSTWSQRYQPLKSALDIGLGFVLLVVFAPLIAVAAFAVRATSTGPAFYTQTRVGKQGRLFQIYKLRTMYHNCENVSGVQWSTPGDARITPLGRFLRRTHIDELPQLINVLRLEMSLVGPRPERPEIIPALEEVIPNYRDRLMIRPGVTGLAQLRQMADVDVESVRRKLAYDLQYIHSVGPWLDIRLMACTGLKMLGIPLRSALAVFRVPGDAPQNFPQPTDAPIDDASGSAN